MLETSDKSAQLGFFALFYLFLVFSYIMSCFYFKKSLPPL